MSREKEMALERWRRWARKNGRIGKTVAEKFHSRYEIITESGCWIWTGNVVGRKPYGKITVDGKHVPAHRLSWKLHNGEIPQGLWVLHRCDVTCCVNPSHLFLGTCLDNVRDMDKKGRRGSYLKKGENQSNAKLKEHQVRMIRESKLSNEKLARMFSVVRGTIYKIRNGLTWTHVI